MNFMVQALIQDLENMGRFPAAVSDREWQDKWQLLRELNPAEYEVVRDACKDGARQAAWGLIQMHDPDPAKTERSVAFESLFSKK